MRNFAAQKIIAFVLLFTLVVPASFFATPNTAHAIGGAGDTTTVIGNWSWTELKTMAYEAGDTISSSLRTANTTLSSIADSALWLDKNIIAPMLWMESGNMLKSVTAGVINFINGDNGKGLGLYVANVSNYKQGISDARAMHFSDALARQSNSPFAAAIASTLRTNYFQSTAGADHFFDAHRCTLGDASSDPLAYVQGNFSKGGWNAWFSLNTDCNNNPYCYTYKAQSVMSEDAANITDNALNQLYANSGFLSWCDTSQKGLEMDDLAKTNTTASGSYTYSTEIGNAAGDPCLDKDGNPGEISTPGSVVADSLKNVSDALMKKWSITGDLEGMAGSLVTLLQTYQMGSMAATGLQQNGLFGYGIGKVNLGINNNDSRSNYWNSYGNGAIETAALSTSLAQNAATGPASPETLQSNVNAYTTAWDTLFSAADTASSTLNTLISATYDASQAYGNNSTTLGTRSVDPTALAQQCKTYQSLAQQALSGGAVATVYGEQPTVEGYIQTATDLVQRINQEKGDPLQITTYTSDVSSLASAHPNAGDVASMQSDATPSPVPLSIPANTLDTSVNGQSQASLISQLQLITANAQSMISQCAPVKVTATTPATP
ncbi:MAG TPA: hypothetical protein VF829_02760 [Candidatus Paceibacterota bacterium]